MTQPVTVFDSLLCDYEHSIDQMADDRGVETSTLQAQLRRRRSMVEVRSSRVRFSSGCSASFCLFGFNSSPSPLTSRFPTSFSSQLGCRRVEHVLNPK